MAKVSKGLTEKQKAFCRAYVENGGNGTKAYMTAYNSRSEKAACIESTKFMTNEAITEYIATLLKPIEAKTKQDAIMDREWKRNLIKERIEYCTIQGNDNAVARYLDILNKMDSEYINININKDDTTGVLDSLDTETLKALATTPANTTDTK
jgi:hypothetical protein